MMKMKQAKPNGYDFRYSVRVAKVIAATSGNRTRAARVAGEHSTTEPTLLAHRLLCTFTNLTLERDIFIFGIRNEQKASQSVGFEPTLPEGI